MRPPFPLPLVLSLVLAGAAASGCKPLCDNDLTCEEYEQCDRLTGRCVPADMQSAASCGSTGDCKDGRVCVEGVCAHAPACLYLGGTWEVWDAVRDGGPTGTVQAIQDLDTCLLGFTGAALPHLDAGLVGPLGEVQGLVLPNALRHVCSGRFGGNETLLLACEPDAGGPTYHLYARPDPRVDALSPKRCRVNTECAQNEACAPNLVGIPSCRAAR